MQYKAPPPLKKTNAAEITELSQGNPHIYKKIKLTQEVNLVILAPLFQFILMLKADKPANKILQLLNAVNIQSPNM